MDSEPGATVLGSTNFTSPTSAGSFFLIQSFSFLYLEAEARESTASSETPNFTISLESKPLSLKNPGASGHLNFPHSHLLVTPDEEGAILQERGKRKREKGFWS